MINWKLRFKNRATLISLIGLILTFVYTVLGFFNVVPPVSQSEVYDALLILVEILAVIGIITDPTTRGITDSTKALNYNEPK